MATFPHPGGYLDFLIHADLCGDAKEEVVVYNETMAWIFAHGGCDLTAPSRRGVLPQNRRLYNWTIYSGWEDVDHVFFTPGSVRLAAQQGPAGPFLALQEGSRVRFQGLSRGSTYGLYGIAGSEVASSGPLAGREWAWETGGRRGLIILKAIGGHEPFRRIFVLD